MSYETIWACMKFCSSFNHIYLTINLSFVTQIKMLYYLTDSNLISFTNLLNFTHVECMCFLYLIIKVLTNTRTNTLLLCVDVEPVT